MVDKRLELHNILKNIMPENQKTNVYFQPPEELKIKYPCIIYSLQRIETRFADDQAYNFNRKYQIMYIDANPDSNIPLKLLSLKRISMDRTYVSDNLNHYVYSLYY